MGVLWVLLLLAARAFAAVVRFLCWHELKLEFWHFARPKLNLRFVLASVFAVLSGKKNATTGGLHCPKTCSAVHFGSFFSVFSCVCVCRISHRFLQCFCIARLSAHAGFDLHLSFNSVRGFGAGGGGSGGDDVHATATCVFFFFC